MKKIIAILLIICNLFTYSQKEKYSFHKKLSTWNKIENDNVEMNKISFSTNEKFLAAAGASGTLIIWGLDSGNILHNLSDTSLNKSYFPREITHSPNGKYFVSVGTSVSLTAKKKSNKNITAIENKVIKIYEASNYSLLNEIKYDTIADILSCAFSPDSKYLITGENQSPKNNISILRVYETQNWKEISSIKIDYTPWKITFSNTGKELYTGSSNGFIKIYTFENQSISIKKQIKLSNTEISEFNLSHDNSLISINEDPMYIYNIQQPDSKTLICRNCWSNLYACSFSKKRKYIVLGGRSNNWILFNLNDKGESIISTQGDINNGLQNENGYNITKPIFSLSDKYIAVPNDAGMIYIYVKK